MIIKQYDVGLVVDSCRKLEESLISMKENGQINIEIKSLMYEMMSAFEKLLLKIKSGELTDPNLMKIIPPNIRDPDKLIDMRNILTKFGKQYNATSFTITSNFDSFIKILSNLLSDYKNLFRSYTDLRSDLLEKEESFRVSLARYHRECQRGMRQFKNDMLADHDLKFHQIDYDKYIKNADDFVESSTTSSAESVTSETTGPGVIIDRVSISTAVSKPVSVLQTSKSQLLTKASKQLLLQTSTTGSKTTEEKLIQVSTQKADKSSITDSCVRNEKACSADLKTQMYDKSCSVAVKQKDAICETTSIVTKDQLTTSDDLLNLANKETLCDLSGEITGDINEEIIRTIQQLSQSSLTELLSLLEFCNKHIIPKSGGLGMVGLLEKLEILTGKENLQDALSEIENLKHSSELRSLFSLQDTTSLISSLKCVKQSLEGTDFKIFDKFYKSKESVLQDLSGLKSSGASLLLASILSLMLGLLLGLSMCCLYKNRCVNKTSSKSQKNVSKNKNQKNQKK